MEKDKIEFFVLKGTEEELDITKMIECLDENKGEYIINYITQNSENINNPKVKVTFTTGECTEYEENEMFSVILNYVKIGMKLPNK